jgi:hypothetical protein
MQAPAHVDDQALQRQAALLLGKCSVVDFIFRRRFEKTKSQELYFLSMLGLMRSLHELPRILCACRTVLPGQQNAWQL